MVVDPKTQTLGDLKDYYSNFSTGNPIPEYDTVYIQLSPYDEEKSQVTLPTMPYRFGFNYGNRKPSTSPQETLAVESPTFQDTTATLYAWAVYVGDQSSAANVSGLDSSTLLGYYTSTGGSVNLTEDLLNAAMDKLKETNANPGPEDHAQITLVAYYYKLDDQFAVQFMDYDPAAAANPSASDYKNYGGVAVVKKQGDQEHLYYKDVCGVGGSLSAPYRSVKGYRFMGWYTKPGGPDVAGNIQVFANANGSMTLMLTGNTPDTPAEIKDNVTLYSWYVPDDMATMTLSFVLQKDGKDYPLNVTYPVRYNKAEGISAVIELPGHEDGVKVTAVKDNTGAALNTSYYEPVEAEGSTTANTLHESVSFHTGKLDSYPTSCTVYFEGDVNMVAVVVVHQLDHTKKVDGGGYAYDEGSIYVEYKHTLILESDKPSITEDFYPNYALGTLGVYDAPSQTDVHYYRYTEGSYGITGTQLSTGEAIRWVVVVPYARSRHYLRFTNLGQSQSDTAFSWKQLYVGEALASYLPNTPAGGYYPRLYGTSATFREWYYWNKAEYEKPADDPTRHKLNAAPEAMPDYDLVLEAQYDGQPVDYTLLIWVENADDDGYTQLGRQVIHNGAYAGEVITVRQVTLAEARSQFSNYPEDHVLPVASSTERITNSPYVDLRGILNKTVTVNNQQKSVELTPYITYSDYQRGVTANGQGTATVNVYFKRKYYRLRFDVGYSVADSSTAPVETYVPLDMSTYTSGDVYGLVNGEYQLLSRYGDNWFIVGSQNNTGVKPYAQVDGQWVELTPTPVAKPQRYVPSAEYILHPEVDNVSPQFGIYGEKYEQLDITTVTGTSSQTNKTVYLLTNTLTVGEQYLLVSKNSAGNAFALSFDGKKGNGVKNNSVTIHAEGDGITAKWIDPDDVESKSIWTVNNGNGTGRYEFHNGSYNIQRVSGIYFDTDDYGGSAGYNDWVWDGTNNRLTNYSDQQYYLYFSENGNSGKGNFTVARSQNSIYLYKLTTVTITTDTTTYAYSYQGNPHAGARYTSSEYTGSQSYTADQLTERNGSLWYFDGNAYVPVTALEIEYENVYTYNGQTVTPTRWLIPYEGGYYKKETTTAQKHTYYFGNSSNASNYTTNAECNSRFTSEGKSIDGGSTAVNPFIKTTDTIHSENRYHDSYEYVRSGTTYTIYYWDIVAKYGANIYDMWPSNFKSQNSGNREYRFIGWLANRYCNYYTTKGSTSSIKGKIDCMTDMIIKTRESSTGSYVARAVTVNPDGTFGDEVTHEFRSRYSAGYARGGYTFQTYVYRYEVKNPNTNGYTTKYEMVVLSEYGHPASQNAGDISGYNSPTRDLIGPNGQPTTIADNESNYNNNRQTIALQLPPGTTETVYGALMRFRYEPISYNLIFGYAGDLSGTITGLGTASVPFTQYLSNVMLGTGSSSKHIYDYTTATLPNPNPTEYYFTGNWYDNAACTGDPVLKAGDANYNKTFEMPASEFTLYAEMRHKAVTVTLNLGEDGVDDEDKTVTLNGKAENYVNSTWTWQAPLKNMLRNADDNDYSTDFTPEKSVPEDADYYWVFDGWSTKTNGTKEDEYIYNQPQMADITLYPIWKRMDNPKPGSVIVIYEYYDEDQEKYVRFYPTNVGPNPLTSHPGTTNQIMIGDPFTMLAPEISGYTPVEPSVGPVVVTKENFEVTFKYRQTSWTYTVNYYIEVDPLTIGSDSWLYGEGTFATGQIKEKIATITGNTEFQYHLFNYLEPDNCPDWAEDMTFVRYEYNGKQSTNSYIAIHPDKTNNTAVIDVYLKPDTESVNIPDIVKFYSGKNFKDYTEADPVVVPSIIGTLAAKTETRFVYYNSAGGKMDPEDVVHAGAYGVRAYITLTLGTGNTAKTYVIWKSAGANTDPVPLHLYIQRRTVILYSASNTITYTNGDQLAIANAQTDVYCRPGTGTAQEIAIQELYNELKLVDYQAAANGQPEVIGNAGFVGSDGLIYEFSSSSFRRNPGTSLNLFTYKKQGETQLSDYYFYVMFGELTVNG